MRIEAEQMKKELDTVKTHMVAVHRQDKEEIQSLRSDLMKTKSKLKRSTGNGGDTFQTELECMKIYDEVFELRNKLKGLEQEKDCITKENQKSAESYRDEIVRLKNELNHHLSAQSKQLQLHKESDRLKSEILCLKRSLREEESNANYELSRKNEETRRFEDEIYVLNRKIEHFELNEKNHEILRSKAARAEELELLYQDLQKSKQLSDKKGASAQHENFSLKTQIQLMEQNLHEANSRERELAKGGFDEETKLHDYIRELKREVDTASEQVKIMEKKMKQSEQEHENEIRVLEAKLIELKKQAVKESEKAAMTLDKTLSVALDRNDDLQNRLIELIKESDRNQAFAKQKVASLENKYKLEISSLQVQLDEAITQGDNISSVEEKIAEYINENSVLTQKIESLKISHEQLMAEKNENILQLEDQINKLSEEVGHLTSESIRKKEISKQRLLSLENEYNLEIKTLKEQIDNAVARERNLSTFEERVVECEKEKSILTQQIQILQLSKDQSTNEANEEIMQLKDEARKLLEQVRNLEVAAQEQQNKQALEQSALSEKSAEDVASLQSKLENIESEVASTKQARDQLQSIIENKESLHKSEQEMVQKELLRAKEELESLKVSNFEINSNLEKVRSELESTKVELLSAQEIKEVVEHSNNIELKQHQDSIRELEEEIVNLKLEITEKDVAKQDFDEEVGRDEVLQENQELKNQINLLNLRMEQLETDLEEEMDNHLKDSDLWMMQMEKVKSKLLSEHEEMKIELAIARDRAKEAERREIEEREKLTLEMEEVKIQSKKEAEELLNRQAMALSEKVELLKEKACYWSNLLKEEKVKAINEGKRAQEALAATEAAALEAVNTTLKIASPRSKSRSGRRSSSTPPVRPGVVKKKTSWFGLD